MLSTDHYLHLVFDHANDFHYTDNLLVLDGEAYLWYVLRRQYHFETVIFVRNTAEGIRVKTFDSDSEQALKVREGGILSFFKARPEAPAQHVESRSFRLKELETSETELLDWLLALTKKKELKKKKTAFAMTLGAFEKVYRASEESGRQELLERIRRPDGRSVLILRLTPQAERLEEAFLGKDAVLPQLSQDIAKALSGLKEPLTAVLDRQLPGQLVCLHQVEEARNMLLHRAVMKDEWPDSLEALEDQAAYLQACCSGVTRRREVYGQLQDAGFREELREKAAQLRQKCPGLSMEKALVSEGLLPEQEKGLTAEYDDPLVRSLQSLQLPAAFPKYSQWAGGLERIRKNYRTLWNRPRNALVMGKAELFCREANAACQRQDWDTANDALQLLRFCGEQICAAEKQEAALSFLFDHGETLINLSVNVFWTHHQRYLFESDHIPEGSYADQMKWEQEMTRRIQDASLDTDQLNLHILRSALQSSIVAFSKREVSDEVLKRIYQSKEAELRKEAERAVQQTEPEPEPEYTDIEDFEDFPYFGWKKPAAAEETDTREQDRQAGERLLKKAGLS